VKGDTTLIDRVAQRDDQFAIREVKFDALAGLGYR